MNHHKAPALESAPINHPDSLSTGASVTLGDCRFISHVTVKQDGSYECTNSTMRYFFKPTPPPSLHSIVQNIQKKRPFRWFNHPKHLDSIIAGCLSPSTTSELPSLEEHILGTRKNVILTWRGILTKIFLGESVTLHVSLIDGILYMEEEDTKPKWRARRYTFGDAIGMAFEDAYTCAKPKQEGQNQAHRIANTSESSAHVDTQWGNVITRTLGDLNLVFCGEVDAVRESDPASNTDDGTDTLDFLGRRIELKCKSSKGKSAPWPRWHMQSHLLAVPEIFIGYRDDSSKIVRTRLVRTQDIKPASFEERIEKGYRVLKELKERLSTSTDTSNLESGTSLNANDNIWKVAIGKWTLGPVTRLGDAEAQKVKRRREDPSRPIERVGIVPKALVEAIQANREGSGTLV
ncbi:hypothetical protein VKT23_011451 [Stygiomarasmius scandens]|uniref:Decapping nuclease n=1 Tax=Marasmiellus scandens TaxID=2682957 RepID=A0ABR1JDT9_9AGAR